jgi:hypothetical protein
LNERLVRELKEKIADLPRQATPRMIEFSADTAGAARDAASSWLNDFNLHGPLEIESIKTSAYGGRFVAVVSYWPEGLKPRAVPGAASHQIG